MVDRTKVLFFGHMANDSLYTSLPPLLPVLALQYSQSAATLGLIPAAYLMTASFLQIGVGYLHDKKRLTILMPVGLLLGGLSVASIGFAGNYSLIVFLAFLGGVGSAFFHPIATALSSVSSRRSTSVSFFMTGGDLGLALGSFICSVAVTVLGLSGTALLFILPFIASMLSLQTLKHESIAPPSESRSTKNDLKALSMALTASFLRATTNVVLLTYLPLYLSTKGVAVPLAGGVLTIMILAGAAGMISAGFFGDRLGKINTVRALLVSSAVFIPFAVLASPEHALLAFPLVGFGLYGAHPLLVAISHDIMPKNLGMASALMYGFTFGVANLFVPVAGLAVDFSSYETVFLALTCLPVTATFIVSKIRLPVSKHTLK